MKGQGNSNHTVPTYSTCVYCKRNDSPRTREHVFAEWIAREFSHKDWRRTIYPDAGQMGIESKNSIGLVLKKVCKRCNNGWMRKLESETKPIMLPLIHGKRTTLSLDDQTLLARWLIKTASAYDLVAKHTRNNLQNFFTSDERHSLMNTLSLPPDAGIFIAPYTGTIGEVFTLESHRAPPTSRKTHEYLVDTHSYAGTFVIKHVAMQVFLIRRGKTLTNANLTFVVPEEWDGVAPQIWPPSKPIDWPPRFRLDDKGLISFARRWEKQVFVI
jgi:hypothetical protein